MNPFMNNTNNDIDNYSVVNDIAKIRQIVDEMMSGKIIVQSVPPVTFPRDRQGLLAPMQIYIEWSPTWETWVAGISATLTDTGDTITQTGYYMFLPTRDKDQYTVRKFVA